MTPFQRALKRLLDVLVSAILLTVLSPLLLIIALAIKLAMPGTVFFRQQRPGLHGKPFLLIKFRSMSEAKDAQGNLLPSAQRLTPLGRFLRRTSLDELPELWNVLRGEMSLVGPRPLLMRYYPYYTARERKRFEVLPGLTGWAQINGRNNLPWDERLELDVWYVEHRSLRLDLKIIMLTWLRVLQQSGVQVAPESLMLDLDEERRN
jgi:sugar transferase EpsL